MQERARMSLISDDRGRFSFALPSLSSPPRPMPRLVPSPSLGRDSPEAKKSQGPGQDKTFGHATRA